MTNEQREIIEQAKIFVDCLFEPDDILRTKIVPSNNTCRGITVSELIELIKKEDFLPNDPESNRYCGINPRQAKGGNNSTLVACNHSLFAAFEAKTEYSVRSILEEANFPGPTMITACGDQIHVFWRLESSIYESDDWVQSQKEIASKLGTEEGSEELCYEMPFPGQHNKSGEQCEIIKSDAKCCYRLDRLVKDTKHYDSAEVGQESAAAIGG